VSTGTVFHQRTKAPKEPKSAKSPKSVKSGPAKPSTPSLVDPRLQARRVEVARGQGRRRLRWVVLGVLVVVLIVGAFALVRSPALDVDRIEVRGAARTEQAEAREASGIALGSALVSLDAPAAERRLEAIPWVERATVSRSWPGTVRIALVERTPVAVVGTGAQAVQVDRDGRALAPASGADLPVVAGDPVAPGEHGSPTQRWVVATVAGLPADLRREVAAAAATPSGIRLTLRDGIDVRWGDASQPTAKADAVQVLLEQADRSTIATIDVTVPRAATVTRS
jgi:cell division protein FtsQ